MNGYADEENLDHAEKELLVIEGVKKTLFRILGIFWLVSTVFLFLRIFLVGIGSDPQAIFVAFIYFVSDIFLLPFWGIFPQSHTAIQPGHPRFDGPAATAIFCYSILILLAVGVTFIVIKILKTGKQVKESVEKNNPVDPTTSEQVVK